MSGNGTAALSLEEQIQRLFSRRLQLEVAIDTDLFDSGLLDSLTFVALLAHLEEELGSRLPLDRLELADFRSIASIAGLVERGGPPL